MTKSSKTSKIPNPGSDEAIEQGCTCPVMDNHHGQGRPTGHSILWVRTKDCPLHGDDWVKEEESGG